MVFTISLLGSSVLTRSSLSDSVSISLRFTPLSILSLLLLECTGVCYFFFNLSLAAFGVVLMLSSLLAKRSSLSEYCGV